MNLKNIIAFFLIIILTGIIFIIWKEQTKYETKLIGLDEKDKWKIKNFQPDKWKLWNKNPNFKGEYKNHIENGNIDFAPIYQKDWSYQCYSWKSQPLKEFLGDWSGNIDGSKDGNLPIDKCSIILKNNKVIMYAKQDSNRFVWQYGIARVIQGDYIFWIPENVNQFVPTPLKVKDKRIILSLDYKINKTKSYWWKYPTNWLAISVNIWFTSPQLKKPIVTDLIVYLNSNKVFTREEKANYIYQYVLSKNSTGWQHLDIDISFIIKERILKQFNINYAYNDLEIKDLEFLIEALHGEAEVELKHLAIYYKEMPEPTSINVKLYKTPMTSKK